ncbi:MarR family winged helix-turn-helix transcriptional regulator [Deinococcus sonorensis]|uniref:MarR family transcriptional regulator n=1 Tax=Deinococcus sonorensis KR-87 TaxID=694439 RepID=A0AAU7UFV1_9DEIO
MSDEGHDRRREQSFRRPAILSWLRLALVVQRTTNDARPLFRTFDLTGAQFDVIAQIGAHPGLPQHQLGAQLRVTEGNVSQLIQTLEHRGLVERRVDGRSKRLFLTARGRALFDQVVPQHEDWVAERFSVLTAEEQAELLRLLHKLDRAHRADPQLDPAPSSSGPPPSGQLAHQDDPAPRG